jgi:hypothetical protein
MEKESVLFSQSSYVCPTQDVTYSKTYPSIKTGAMSLPARWIASLFQGGLPSLQFLA